MPLEDGLVHIMHLAAAAAASGKEPSVETYVGTPLEDTVRENAEHLQELFEIASFGVREVGIEKARLALYLYFVKNGDTEAAAGGEIDGVDRFFHATERILYDDDLSEFEAIWPLLSKEAQAHINDIGDKPEWWREQRELKCQPWGRRLADDDPSAVMIGMMSSASGNVPVTFKGEGHLITVAPTGSGKGLCHVVPNLLTYPGSILVLDIKDGENLRWTGEHRENFGKVFRFSPYDGETDCYNPLQLIGMADKARAFRENRDFSWADSGAWGECQNLAHLLVIPEKNYFDDRARALLRDILYFVCIAPDLQDDERNMGTVCHFVYGNKDMIQDLWDEMRETGDVRLKETADTMEKVADKEFSATLGTIHRSLEPWRSPEIQKATSSHNPDWIPADLRRSPAMAEFSGEPIGPQIREDGMLVRGSARTVYVSFPQQMVSSNISVLRVLLGQHMSEIMMLNSRDPESFGTGGAMERFPSVPVMFLADEFPQLGEMPVISDLLTMGRGYKIRVWLFAQDVGQIAEHYRNWRGVISGCIGQSYMNINDNETARVVSERLPQRTPMFGTPGPLASVSDLMGPDFEDTFVYVGRNKKPMKLEKMYAPSVPWMCEITGLTPKE